MTRKNGPITGGRWPQGAISSVITRWRLVTFSFKKRKFWNRPGTQRSAPIREIKRGALLISRGTCCCRRTSENHKYTFGIFIQIPYKLGSIFLKPPALFWQILWGCIQIFAFFPSTAWKLEEIYREHGSLLPANNWTAGLEAWLIDREHRSREC